MLNKRKGIYEPAPKYMAVVLLIFLLLYSKERIFSFFPGDFSKILSILDNVQKALIYIAFIIVGVSLLLGIILLIVEKVNSKKVKIKE